MILHKLREMLVGIAKISWNNGEGRKDEKEFFMKKKQKKETSFINLLS